MLRIVCLSIAVVAITWAATDSLKLTWVGTVVSGVIFSVLAIGLFFAVGVYDEGSRQEGKEHTPVANSGSQIHPPFAAAYQEYGAKLGKALSNPIIVSPWSYQAAHERATVLWLNTPLKTYIIRQGGTWEEDLTPSHTDGRESDTWQNDTWLAENFRVPKGLHPPWGAVAYFWKHDQDRWNETSIGWRIWHCGFETISTQRFEHGRMIGSFRWQRNAPAGMVFVLLNDFKWGKVLSSEEAGDCAIAN